MIEPDNAAIERDRARFERDMRIIAILTPFVLFILFGILIAAIEGRL